MRYATNNPNALIEATIDPYPLTANIETATLGYNTIFYLVVAIVLLPGMIASFIV